MKLLGRAIYPPTHRQFLRCYPSIAKTLLSTWTVDSATGIITCSPKTKDSVTPRFQTVIGLEIHAQLNIATKLFSGCPRPTSTFAKPNSHVWPLDVGVPGFLPQLSQEAVQAAVLSAAATKCHIPPMSRFERKHYFYADLPLGYQVTQQRWPLARDGVLHCRMPTTKKNKKSNNTTTPTTFSARIERIQLEQDTGKTILMPRHDGTVDSLVDFNRAGCALIEIVFYPDLRSSIQAATAVETLRTLLQHVGTCTGKMEDGSLRCDLNISIAPLLDHDDDHNTLLERTGNRVEVKNLNSLRQVQQAAEYEAIRQAKAWMEQTPTQQETRTFDVKSGKTVVIRTKEGAKDYRFMPEPDLPPVVLDSKVFGGMDLASFLQATLPELPDDAHQRLQSTYGLSSYTCNVLTSDPPAIRMLDEAIQEALDQTNGKVSTKEVAENVANLLCNELFALVREHETTKAALEDGEHGRDVSVKHSAVTGQQLGVVVALLVEGVISNTMAKQLLKILYTEEMGNDPRQVASQRGFQLITDAVELQKLCHAVIEESPQEMERYRMGGKYARKITKFLLGQAMLKSNMNAHPERLNEIMISVLDTVEPDVEK